MLSDDISSNSYQDLKRKAGESSSWKMMSTPAVRSITLSIKAYIVLS